MDRPALPAATPLEEPAAAVRAAPPTLERALGAWDGASLTIGAVIGTGIFLTAGDVARALPHPLLALGAWIVGGLLVLAGALSYAEMGAMYPRAGGLYHFLREAWGPLPGFLYGWTCLLVIMTGGIAAIAVGFGDYFGALVPAFSSARTVLAVGAWHVNGAQVAALLAITLLTAANHFGVR
jgi:APA family basic amino acid/polyamine antiporter